MLWLAGRPAVGSWLLRLLLLAASSAATPAPALLLLGGGRRGLRRCRVGKLGRRRRLEGPRHGPRRWAAHHHGYRR